MKCKQITICWRIKQKMCAKVWPKENRNVAETWQIIFDFGRCWQNVFILNLFGRNNSQFCESIIRTIANSQFAKPALKIGLERCRSRSAEMHNVCTSQKMPQNKYSLARIDFDTAKNIPSKITFVYFVIPKIVRNRIQSIPYLQTSCLSWHISRTTLILTLRSSLEKHMS